MTLGDTLIDAAVDDTLPPRDDDPVEARAALDAIAARMFGATPQPLQVGRFVLLDRIGRGGMGVVYAAYDPQLDRKIAIKLLAPPGDSSRADPEAEARLLREARAAARLDHPNVVTIHEVGTWQGRVFVAMEYVDGLTLKGWLAAASRSPAEILGVFLQAGRGLAAAHAAGIVHRDFKPENALVAKDGTVHVVDFGLARASVAGPDPHVVTSERGGEDTELTRTGALMGTPAYMAPEQHKGEPAGVAADQFAFCVALWEAWYGARPFTGETLGALALAVIEGEIATPPADTRVTTRQRRILERGLASDPDARHPSMTALLDALAHDPGRRLRRIAIGSAVAIALVGAGLAVGHTAATPEDPCDGGAARHAEVWSDADRAAIRSAFTATGKPYAAVALAQVEQRLDEHASAWAASHRDACTATRHGEQSDEMLDLRMACLERRLGEVGSLVDLFAQADEQTVTRAVRSADGLTPIAACDDATALREVVPLPEAPDARAEILAIQREIGRGKQLRDLGRFADGVRIGTETVARLRALDHAPTLAEALVLLASSQAHAGDLEASQATFETAVWAAIAGRNATAQTEATVALVTITGHSRENVDDGKRWGEHARALLVAQGDPPAQLATLEGNLGNIEMTRGDRKAALVHFRESIRLYEESLGPEHMHVGRMTANLAVLLRQEGDLDAAEEAYQHATALLERTLGPGHPDMGSVISNYGALLAARGDMDGALAKYRTALEIGASSVEPDHPQLGHAHNNIGSVLLEKGDHDGAERHARKAIAIWEGALGRNHSLLASPYGVLGRSLHARGRHDAAIDALERALALPPSAAMSATDRTANELALAQARDGSMTR